MIGVVPQPTTLPLHVQVQRLAGGLPGPDVMRRLQQTRSTAYVDALRRLDTGSVAEERAILERAVAEITREFEDLPEACRPHGVVQKCALEPGFEVHLLDLRSAPSLSHHKQRQPMPGAYECARSLAIHPGHAHLNTYTFVEVYADHLAPVYVTGLAMYVAHTR
jgi:hypothetical protein